MLLNARGLGTLKTASGEFNVGTVSGGGAAFSGEKTALRRVDSRTKLSSVEVSMPDSDDNRFANKFAWFRCGRSKSFKKSKLLIVDCDSMSVKQLIIIYTIFSKHNAENNWKWQISGRNNILRRERWKQQWETTSARRGQSIHTHTHTTDKIWLLLYDSSLATNQSSSSRVCPPQCFFPTNSCETFIDDVTIFRIGRKLGYITLASLVMFLLNLFYWIGLFTY